MKRLILVILVTGAFVGLVLAPVAGFFFSMGRGFLGLLPGIFLLGFFFRDTADKEAENEAFLGRMLEIHKLNVRGTVWTRRNPSAYD